PSSLLSLKTPPWTHLCSQTTAPSPTSISSSTSWKELLLPTSLLPLPPFPSQTAPIRFPCPPSTETALVKVTNDILSICDQDSFCLLVLLHLSAAFDTVDDSILIHHLSSHLNLHGSVLNWFRSYLSHCLHFISTNGFFSSPGIVSCGVPQGSVLGPLLFNIYILRFGDIVHRHGVNIHMYVDVTKLYLSASTLDSRATAVLTECLSDIKSCMRANFLQLNVNKIEALVISSRQRLRTSGTDSTTIHGYTLHLAKPVRNLGVLFDPQLSFLPHIHATTRYVFPHLRKHCATLLLS
uniref:Reverse transcriptase domain-containing protein n=1 Tax=Callorhinchus milii TaxID=7868 RepID=A0A4W3H3U5_CALMI